MFYVPNTNNCENSPGCWWLPSYLMEMHRPGMAQTPVSMESQDEDLFPCRLRLGNVEIHSLNFLWIKKQSKAKQICFSDVSQRTKNPGNSALSSREAGETSWLSERWGVLGDLHLHPFLIRENVLLEAGPQSPYGEQLQKSVRNVEKQNSPTVQRALMCVGRSQLHTRNLVMWLYRKFYLLKMAQRFLEPQEWEHYL